MKKTALVAAVLAAAFAAPAMAADTAVFADYQSVSLSNAAAGVTAPSMIRLGASFGGANIGEMTMKNEMSYAMTASKGTAGTSSVEFSSLAYNIVGKFPIKSVEGLNVTGRLGMALNYAKAGTNSASKSAFQYGIGAEYQANDQWSVRAGWEDLGKFTDVSGANGVGATALTMGVAYSF